MREFLKTVFERLWSRDHSDEKHASEAGVSDGESVVPAQDLQRHDAAVSLGKHAMRAREFSAAVGHFRRAIEICYDDADSYNDLGVAHLKLQQGEDAADCFHMALHFRGDFADPHYNLGRLAHARGDFRAAIAHVEQAIVCRADYAEAHNLLGSCLLDAGDSQRAIEAFGRAVEFQPHNAHFHSNYGHILIRDFEEFERGAFHIEKALQISPSDAAILCNYCLVLAGTGRSDEVISICDQVLRGDPERHAARLNRALAKLKLKNFSDAWPDYEARRKASKNYLPRPYTFPEWRGEPLAGKTLLIYGEQGLGDEIMFASCFDDVLRQAGKCLIDCSPRLAPLFARSFPGALVHGAKQNEQSTDWLRSFGKVDYQIGAGSLPGHFRKRLEDFPQHNGYLLADTGRVNYWKSRLQSSGHRLNIGIAWRGGMKSTRRSLRSIELDAMLPLLQLQGLNFVSLQHDAASEEVAQAAAKGNIAFNHWPEVVADIDDTAALISALDMVITVCSAPVHLTGALGRSAWVLVPTVAEWRYLESGDTMPWYPGIRMFRQAQSKNWQPVIETVVRELSAIRA